MADEDFEKLLEAAREGAEWALADLYGEYQPRLVRYLKARVAFDAEDLAHEVWLDTAAALPRFEGDRSAFAGWLFTIARRRVVDEQRRAGRRRTTSVPIEDLYDLRALIDVEDDVLGELGVRELIARIRELPPDQADIVLLRAVAGLEVDEVARVLGKRPGAIRVIAHRTLKKLAKGMIRTTEETAPPHAVTDEEPRRFKGRDATQKG